MDRVDGLVLDIGGFDGYWVASLDGVEALSVDVDLEAIYPSVQYVRANGLRLPFKDDVVDVVFALDVIEHVPDEQQLINESLRVLRRGGRLILQTPNVNVQIFPKILQPWVNRRWGHDRVPGFSADHLRGILQQQTVAEMRIMPLAISAFRWAYFPLSLAWRLPGPLGRWVVNLVAAWDSRYLEGDRGSILVQVTR